MAKGIQGRKVEEKVEDEEVRHSVSDKVPSPAHKRFNSLSPLITYSHAAVSARVFLCMCDIGYIQKDRE